MTQYMIINSASEIPGLYTVSYLINLFQGSAMGRHSIEQKRNKRRKQKRKQLALKQTINSGVNHDAEDKSIPVNLPAVVITRAVPFINAAMKTLMMMIYLQDKIMLEKKVMINTTRMKIEEFESFRDKHPYIVTDKQRPFEVWVDGTIKYKGSQESRH